MCRIWRKRPQKRPTHLLDRADDGCQLERAFREFVATVTGNALQDNVKQVALMATW